MLDATFRRTANVIAIDFVHCLNLTRSDFNRLLGQFKLKINVVASRFDTKGGFNNAKLIPIGSEAAAVGRSKASHNSQLAKKRRITAFDVYGQKDDNRVFSLLRRFGRFATESLWHSLYSRLYRELLLDDAKVQEYGKFASSALKNESRTEAVSAIRKQTIRILESQTLERTATENLFVCAVLSQRNQLRDKICKHCNCYTYDTQ